jgi:hypothetical protein
VQGEKNDLLASILLQRDPYIVWCLAAFYEIKRARLSAAHFAICQIANLKGRKKE